MKKIIALLMAAALLLSAAACGRADPKASPDYLPLIPRPNGPVAVSGERLALPAVLRVAAPDFSEEFFRIYAERAGVEIVINEPGTSSPYDPPLLAVSLDEDLPPEAYRLRVAGEGIQIEAADDRGLCWALVTLAALTEDGGLPFCEIEDAPRFAYRGFLLDSVRHFFPVETVKSLIEMTSMVKINAFHWHLTDDQGWRIESKRFPALHEQCAPEYYTQDEIREVIEFARLRGVEVIPEVDVPGHATAILAAYPKLGCAEKPVALAKNAGIRSVILCAGKDSVFDTLDPLLEEIAALFPSPRFHLGGDEAPKDEWKKCSHCARRVEEEGLRDLEDLQGWFTARLARPLIDGGKQIICWNESLRSPRLLEEVPDLIGEFWAELHELGATKRFWEQGGDMIFAGEFAAHLDLPHGAVPLKKSYNYGPGVLGFKGKGLPALGLEACVWTEYIATQERLAALAFPRTYAIAESAWTQPEHKDYKSFLARLDVWLARFPGIGYTPPKKADPGFIAGWKEKIAFFRSFSEFLDTNSQEDKAGTGGRLHWRYMLWVAWNFI